MHMNSNISPTFAGTLKVLNPPQNGQANAGGRATLPPEDNKFANTLSFQLLNRNNETFGVGNNNDQTCKMAVGDNFQLRRDGNDLNVTINGNDGKPAYTWILNMAVDLEAKTAKFLKQILDYKVGTLTPMKPMDELVPPDQTDSAANDLRQTFTRDQAMNSLVESGNFKANPRPPVSEKAKTVIIDTLDLPKDELLVNAFVNMIDPKTIKNAENVQ